jgi:Na+/phosphate symporter
MPRKKVSKSADANRKPKGGINYKTVIAVVMLVIGALFVIFNLTGILYAVVGLALIYFGLKILGGWKSSLIDLQ